MRVLEQILVEGRPISQLQVRYPGLSAQAVAHRVRRTLAGYVNRPRHDTWPPGELVLLIDGLWFTFAGRPWVMYLMGLKACQVNQVRFLDPQLWPGAESKRRWSQALATIPPALQARIRAVVADDFRGVTTLVQAHGWVLQLCHFHLVHHLHGLRGRRKRTVCDRQVRERLYHLLRHALEVPAERTAQRLRAHVQRQMHTWQPPGRFPMVARECLRRWDHYRAYRRHPSLQLPRTTGSVEAMSHRIRTLLRRLGNIRTPAALRLWVTAFIRLRPSVTCNGSFHQPNSFV